MIGRAAALALVLTTGLSAGHAAAKDRASVHPVLVELYTSQGCSDCPVADALIGKLAVRNDVVALSFPITYWDMLGWKDTLASEANTLRQKAYARAMNRSGLYTPQVIVDGVTDVVGNQRDKVMEAIAAARPRESTSDVSLTVTPGDDHITIAIDGDGAKAGVASDGAAVWLMRTLSKATVAVHGGENKNRELSYTNVVRGLERIGEWRGGLKTFTVPRVTRGARHDGIAVVLQKKGPGAVVAARLVALPVAVR